MSELLIPTGDLVQDLGIHGRAKVQRNHLKTRTGQTVWGDAIWRERRVVRFVRNVNVEVVSLNDDTVIETVREARKSYLHINDNTYR